MEKPLVLNHHCPATILYIYLFRCNEISVHSVPKKIPSTGRFAGRKVKSNDISTGFGKHILNSELYKVIFSP
jgi:hypothetical protein